MKKHIQLQRKIQRNMRFKWMSVIQIESTNHAMSAGRWGLTGGWKGGWVSGLVDRWVIERRGAWVDGWMDGWLALWVYEL